MTPRNSETSRNSESRTTAVLLAAGAGTRLGRGPKALLPFRGTTLVAHMAAELLRGGCKEVVVVIGAGAGDVRATALPQGCRFVENPQWQEGMSSSFAAGVAAAGDGPVLVALVDQPGVDSALISTLIAVHRPGRITAAGYRDRDAGNTAAGSSTRTSGGNSTATAASTSGTTEPMGTLRRGNPVLFPRDHAVRAAAMARSDSGARAYLAANAQLVDLVDFSPFTDGADVDTPADLHLLM